ncbi:MAG: YmdB family metallophosphoesterase [Chloroflexia bacterium]|nr:YmdB family metallophosphoesterase [Chloroflexia bacterium]
MNVLIIGDLVGPAAADYLAARLLDLRRDLHLDLVVANAENVAITADTPDRGFGMTPELVSQLLAAGVDVITSGNHTWDGPAAEAVHRYPRLLRPLNVPATRPGRGVVTVEVAGEPVTVVNLASQRGMIRDAEPIYPAWRALERQGSVIVDFHGDSAWEKMSFAAAIDGEAAAVIGTHTHEPTLNLHLLPGGTAFVADVGMTGPSGYPGGFPLTHFAAAYRSESSRDLPPFTVATGPMVLGAVLLQIDAGKTRAIERIT